MSIERETGAPFPLHVDLGGLSWIETTHAGVSWCLLAGGGTGPGSAGTTALIRMAPGLGYPAHRHLQAEDVLVLRGGYRDEFGELRAGQYRQYPAGSTHSPVALGDPGSPEGEGNPACVLFAVARGGVELIGDSDATAGPH